MRIIAAILCALLIGFAIGRVSKPEPKRILQSQIMIPNYYVKEAAVWKELYYNEKQIAANYRESRNICLETQHVLLMNK